MEPIGWFILIGMLVIGLLVLWKWGTRVVYPHARVLQTFGRPKARVKPGFFLWPSIPYAYSSVIVPGSNMTTNLETQTFLTSDGVEVELEVDLIWRIKIQEGSISSKYPVGLLNPDAVLRFQSSWKPSEFEEAVAQTVRQTGLVVIVKYHSSQLSSQKLVKELARKLNVALDLRGNEWGVNFTPQIVRLESPVVVQATEAKVRQQIKKAERMAEAEGLREAVSYLQETLGDSPVARETISAFNARYTLTGVPKGTNITTLGGGLLDALGGLFGSRVSDAEERARYKARSRRNR